MDNNSIKKNSVEITEVERCEVQRFMELSFEELLKKIEELPLEYRAVLAQRLIGNSHGLTVVIGGTNTNTINATVSNSFTIQIGGTAEQIGEQLKNIPDRVFEELIEAIATRLREGEGK